MRSILAISLCLTLAGAALAQDDAQRARDELEHELHDMVRIPPPQLEIVFTGIDAADYALESASFTLDGQTLAAESLTPGKVLFSGTVSPGPHTFASQVTYKEDPRTLFTYMSGTKFKVPGRVEFQAQRGLRLHIKAGVHVAAGADLHGRLHASNQIDPEMLAKLDDGSIPELRRPKIAEVVDAGAPVAVASAAPDVTAPPMPVADDDAAVPEKRGHGSRRTSRKGIVAASGREERQAVAVAKVETVAPQALTEMPVDAGAPVMVAMADKPVAVAPMPAAVAVEAETGLSMGAKLGIVGAVMLLALVGLTLALRKR